MDSLTLSLVFLVFLASLALHFATVAVVPTPQPLPETPKCLSGIDLRILPVLRQNVAVARFVRMQG